MVRPLRLFPPDVLQALGEGNHAEACLVEGQALDHGKDRGRLAQRGAEMTMNTQNDNDGEKPMDALTLSETLARIEKMATQRDALSAAISAYKKYAQKLVGQM